MKSFSAIESTKKSFVFNVSSHGIVVYWLKTASLGMPKFCDQLMDADWYYWSLHQNYRFRTLKN